MKGKIIILLVLLMVPLSFALEEQNLVYDSTQNVVKITYDDINRIKHKNSTSEIINYSYDVQLQGTLSNISFGNSTYKYSYDDRLRVVEEKRIIDGIEFTKTYVYDSSDRLVSEIFNGQDLDYYYNSQNKIDQIRGFINKTNYNALGNPLNRTYFNSRITTFDYHQLNQRLRQIKTGGIQQLNYSYDNVGNIVSINDSINNRSYRMGYDLLDRLTNVTINSFNWVYSYDAVGNIQKIVRNYSETTSFKYDSTLLAHALAKVITAKTGVDVYRHSDLNTSNKTKVLQFYLINEKNATLTEVNWTAEFESGNKVSSSEPFNLSLKENVLVVVEHNYDKGGSYKVNLTGNSNLSSDYETFNMVFGTIANHLAILNKNASTLFIEFNAKNSLSQPSYNWSWNCTNGIKSTEPFNMSASEDLLVVIEHNSSLSLGNLSCIIGSNDGNQSGYATVSFDGIKIEGYNSTKIDTDTLLVKFQIKNYYGTLTDINWNITIDNQKYSDSGITLTQGQITTIEQELNFSSAGTKSIKIMVGSGNFTDTYVENVRLYSLGIQQFINYMKNGTARVYNFMIKNDWNNLTTRWNLTNPSVLNAVNLSQNESLIVVIEENYAQGAKDVSVNAMNSSVLEDIEKEVFTVKHIGINKFETLFENTSRTITSSLVVNNVNPLNVSWRLNNTDALISSSENLELNTSEQAFVVIESTFSNAGIYPLNFLINSSTLNDNMIGVTVS